MDFPSARIVAPLLEVVDSVDSTNAELARRERSAAQPDFAVLATLDQTRGAALAVSVLLRPRRIPADRLGVLSLLGGLAVREAVAARLPGREVAVKWPNDVLVEGRKVSGVLAEVVGEGAVVLGAGINTAMTASELPVPTATSIAIESGAAADPAELADRVLAAYLGALGPLVARLEDAGGDIESSGIRAELEAACGTIGARVRAELPDGRVLTGTGLGIGADGSLRLAVDGSAEPAAILAGDVTHLRYQ